MEKRHFLTGYHVYCTRLQKVTKLQIQFRISRSFRLQNPENLGSKSVFGFAERKRTLKENEKLEICSNKHTLRKPRQTVAIV